MSFSWQERSDESERRLVAAIRVLCGDDPGLLDYLFDKESTKLRKRAGILKEDSWKFSECEQLQIRASLDLWSGSGHLQLWEMLEQWDEGHWRNFLCAIRMRVGIDAASED